VQPEFLWFLRFSSRVSKKQSDRLQVLMVLAVAQLFGFYNPKQVADFLEVPHQQFYTS